MSAAHDRFELAQRHIPGGVNSPVRAFKGVGGDPERLARHPLVLLTPKQHTRFLNSGYADLPKHGPAEGGPFVELDAVGVAGVEALRGALAARPAAQATLQGSQKSS